MSLSVWENNCKSSVVNQAFLHILYPRVLFNHEKRMLNHQLTTFTVILDSITYLLLKKDKTPYILMIFINIFCLFVVFFELTIITNFQERHHTHHTFVTLGLLSRD